MDTAVKSLAKAIDFLFLFTQQRPLLSLPEIARALNIPESTAYRFLVTFRNKNLITQDPQTKKYGLHASVLRLQMAAAARQDICKMASPYLEELSAISGETCELYLRQGDQVVAAEVVGSHNALAFVSDKGKAFPLHAPAGGRAVLAFLPQPFIDAYVARGLDRLTSWTVTDVAELAAALAKVRAEGFAVSFRQVYPGVGGVAAPVFDHRAEVIASLGIAGPDARLTDERVRSLGPLVIKEAHALSAALGAAPHRAPEAKAERAE
jgi:DNA-binding IclR family transcriptional regulator